MPLDPRISLMYQPPQIPMPDVGRTMLQAAQLQEAQLRRQAHEVAMQDLLREREREKALQAYVTRQMGRSQPAPLSQLMPDAASGMPLSQVGPQASGAATDPPWPYESFTRDDMETARTPGGGVRQSETQRPAPGVQAHTVTEVAPGRRQQATTVTSAQGPQRLTDSLDWREMYAASPKQGMALYKTMRDMERTEATDEMQLLAGTVNALDDLARMVHDQPSLDQARAALGRIPGMGAEIAGTLPAVYDDAAWEKVLQRLVPVKQRLQQSQVGLQPVWGKTGPNQYGTAQLTQTGEAKATQYPPGFEPLPPFKMADTGTGTQPVGPGGLPLGMPITKDVRTPARDKTLGEVEGATQGKRPEVAREKQAGLAQLEDTYQTVIGAIERAELAAKTKQGWLPATGPGTPTVGAALPASNPGQVAQELTTLRNQMGLDAMVRLKEAGGTLTPVTDTDIRILQGMLGDLPTAQAAGEATLKSKLDEVRRHWTTILQRGRENYQRDFEQYRAAPSAQAPPSPYGHMRPQDMSPEQRATEKQWLRQQLGQ